MRLLQLLRRGSLKAKLPRYNLQLLPWERSHRVQLHSGIHYTKQQHRWMTAFNFFKRLHSDIFLQEMHWTAELENTINSEWNGQIIYNHGTANSCGVAILFHPGLVNQPTQRKRDSHGRILATKITLDDQELNLVNIYAPRSNTERQSFYRSLSNYLTDDDNNIIAGDFNSIADPQRGKSGGNANARQSANTVLQTISAQFHLIDIWHSHHYNQLCYTWTGKKPTDNSIIRTRKDKFLLSTALSHLVTVVQNILLSKINHGVTRSRSILDERFLHGRTVYCVDLRKVLKLIGLWQNTLITRFWRKKTFFLSVCILYSVCSLQSAFCT